ncbi:unnamed protein product [Sympodiomycopsis kandeliae]
MGPRKAPHKATDYFAETETAGAAAGPSSKVSNGQSGDALEDAPTSESAALPSSSTTSTNAAPQSSKSLQSRLKLLRLKIKKTTNVTKQKSLQVEMKDVERRIREENGRAGGSNKPERPAKNFGSGANAGAIGKRKRYDDDNNGSSSNAVTGGGANPWKRMEAERRMGYSQSTSSDHRREKRANERANNTRCFACRALGHSAKECPESLNSNSNSLSSNDPSNLKGNETVGICFRCGSSEHSLKTCNKKKKFDSETQKEILPHATCFICSQKGHLSSNCKQNTERGIYPNGGNCKICQSVHHLVKDCPESKGKTAQKEGDEQDNKVKKEVVQQPTVPVVPKKVVSF